MKFKGSAGSSLRSCSTAGQSPFRPVSAMEAGDPFRAMTCFDEVHLSLAATKAHTAARTVCLEALGIESSTGN